MVKVIIVTGFLGSGKTTFLQNILKDSGKNVGILINELGKIGLDDKILQNSIIDLKDTILLDNGCLCCSKLDEIKDALESIFSVSNNMQYAIIETTGLANVAPIVFTILSDIFLSNHFCIHKIITCIDALNYQNHIKNQENINQIASASEIIVTKTDICNDFDLNCLKSINKSAFVYLKDEYDEKMFFNKNNSMPFISFENTHTSDVLSLSFKFNVVLEWEKFCIWLSLFLHNCGNDVLRVKGILDVGGDECVSINGLYHHIYPSEHIKITPKQSSLIFIFKNINKDSVLKSFIYFLGLKEGDFVAF